MLTPSAACSAPLQAAKWFMCCLRCCMWCLEQVLKFINRNAYIMVACKGFSYCEAAGEAVSLIVKNALRLLAVNVVGDSLIWLGKLAVAAGGGLVAFFMANSRWVAVWRCLWTRPAGVACVLACGWCRGLLLAPVAFSLGNSTWVGLGDTGERGLLAHHPGIMCMHARVWAGVVLAVL
jgi:hypothetical protein